jgi:N-acetylglucosaminyldiphosphoundecaprenol N-acetyl-beta-D-mannosaminyltransferase
VTRKVDLFGVGVSVTDYARATGEILDAARQRRSYGVSALATHGLMEASRDARLREQVNRLDLVTPDGQPVRWALNALGAADLQERVYGPDLVGHVCVAAAREGVGVYLFGSTPETCRRFADELERRYPGLQVVDIQPDRFREATADEDAADVARMNASGAGVVLVGRGCPRQERWVAEHLGRVDAAMLAVGAAFDYYAGTLKRPPAWMQRHGLEWLFRVVQEPRRLARRYLVHNTRFLLAFATALWQRKRTPAAAAPSVDVPDSSGRA